MQIKEILNGRAWKRLKKRKALGKILDKLDKRLAQFDGEFDSQNSNNKNKMLRIRQETARRHRIKVNNLIAELDQK